MATGPPEGRAMLRAEAAAGHVLLRDEVSDPTLVKARRLYRWESMRGELGRTR